MKPAIKLSSKNIAGCNSVWMNDDKSISGRILLDLDGNKDHIVLEFPNPTQVDLAIERLQEMRELWDRAKTDPALLNSVAKQ